MNTLKFSPLEINLLYSTWIKAILWIAPGLKMLRPKTNKNSGKCGIKLHTYVSNYIHIRCMNIHVNYDIIIDNIHLLVVDEKRQ